MRPLISEPKLLYLAEAEEKEKHYEIVSFIHTSGIWIVGSSPFLLSPQRIEDFSGLIVKQMSTFLFEPNSKKPMSDYFGFDWTHSSRSLIGKLNFIWVVKEIEGKPEDDFLYLLAKCKTCGQTNPTGINLGREIIYKGNTNNSTMYSQNTWNNYTLNDLKRLGFRVEKWDKDNLEQYMQQGISIPIENDVKKMKINDCKCQCINCGNMMQFSANDCFI